MIEYTLLTINILLPLISLRRRSDPGVEPPDLNPDLEGSGDVVQSGDDAVNLELLAAGRGRAQ